MPNNNELRLFISSTFRDMQGEREHLVRKVFPEIRALCRARGVTFTEVDLRWGVTEEEAELGQVIRICLEEVDRCRPYFIGMIGNRYGWVPELHEIHLDPDLLANYPWIKEIANEGVSVTEMEFIHGVFDTPESDELHARFYHRQDDQGGRDHHERLDALIERARATGHPFHNFASVEELGEKVYADLIATIDHFWPESETPSPLTLERRAHTAFAASRTRAYIPNPLYIKRFNEWIDEGKSPLVIHGGSGLGKSALAAYLAESFRKEHRDAFVVEHYVGAWEGSGSAVALMRHVIQEICERFSIDEELPNAEAELEKSFPDWLYRAEHLAAQSDTQIVIVLDALNQLGASGQRLSWLPRSIPPRVRLVLSTTPGDALEGLKGRWWEQLEVTPIDDVGLRQSIVVRALGEFRKKVTADQVEKIVNDPKSASPLYLRLVAEELRLHGLHETIGAEIDRYATTNSLDETFALMLERIERDHGIPAVSAFLSMIALSRSGLTETELLGLTRLSRLALSRLLFSFDYHLIRRDGELHFFHDYLRRAVERRYLADEEYVRDRRTALLSYFQGEELSRGSASEIIWQLRELGRTEELAQRLANLDTLHLLYTGEMIYEVRSTWRALMEEGIDLEGLVLESAKQLSRSNNSIDYKFNRLRTLCTQLQSMSSWRSSLAVAEQLREVSRKSQDRRQIGIAESHIGNAHRHLGSYPEAREHFSSGLESFQSINDQRGIANALTNLGLVSSDSSDYDYALDCFRKAGEIFEELGERGRSAVAIGSMGNVHRKRGAFDTALDLYNQALTIHREMGAKGMIANLIASIGNVSLSRNDYATALSAYDEALEIQEELGARSDVANLYGNMATAYLWQGDADRALELYKRARKLHEELGEVSGVAAVMGNIGIIYAHQGEQRHALRSFQEAAAINRELGEKGVASQMLSNIGAMHYTLGEYDQALEVYLEAISIHEDLGDSDRTASTSFNIGNCYRDLGKLESALAYLTQSEELSRELGLKTLLTMVLEKRSHLLLDIAEQSTEQPGYLKEYIAETAVDAWRTSLRSRCRELAEESHTIAVELEDEEHALLSSLVQARIDQAEGDTEKATATILALIPSTSDPEDIAECHTWLWRFDRSREEHRLEALRIFSELLEGGERHYFREMVEELGG